MIRGRRNRDRIARRAEDIFTAALTEILGSRDTMIDFESLANQSLEASITFDKVIDNQLGPEEESTYENE